MSLKSRLNIGRVSVMVGFVFLVIALFIPLLPNWGNTLLSCMAGVLGTVGILMAENAEKHLGRKTKTKEKP